MLTSDWTTVVVNVHFETLDQDKTTYIWCWPSERHVLNTTSSQQHKRLTICCLQLPLQVYDGPRKYPKTTRARLVYVKLYCCVVESGDDIVVQASVEIYLRCNGGES